MPDFIHIIKSKEPEREEIARQIDEFFAKGGKIKEMSVDQRLTSEDRVKGILRGYQDEN